MFAVSNTSPLSNLAIIERLNLLPLQFGEVFIPDTVWTELNAMRNESARFSLAKAKSDGWLKIASLQNQWLAEALLSRLDAGEAAAIALATELKPDVLLIDEREGRQAAAQLDLTVHGVLGILLKAKVAGNLLSIRHEVERLRTQAHFFIAPALCAEIFRLADE